MRGPGMLALSLAIALGSGSVAATTVAQGPRAVVVRNAAATTAPTSAPRMATAAATSPAAASSPVAAPAVAPSAAPSSAAPSAAAAPSSTATTSAAASPSQAPSKTPSKAPSAAPAAGDGAPTPKADAAANPNCTLTVPADPLSAQGLATPYLLSGTGGGACHEADPVQGAFVEATIVNPSTGALSVYHPLVVDQGTRPAQRPVVPALPTGSVVGIWFGFNGDVLTLRGGRSLGQGRCVNGLGGSTFGQFAYCNAPAFFAAANDAISRHRLTVPPLGTGKDGLPCPSVRNFGLVDQDQSDNVTTTYLATTDGRTAQNTAAAALPGQVTKLANGSDNRLLDAFVDPALGCTPFTAPDLTDRGAPSTSLALNELQAAAHQASPQALVPLTDPMTLVDGQQSVQKTNLYRAGVDQPSVGAGGDTPAAYCSNIATVGRQRLNTDHNLLVQAPSPDAGTNLFDFLTQRLQGSLGMLGCPGQ